MVVFSYHYVPPDKVNITLKFSTHEGALIATEWILVDVGSKLVVDSAIANRMGNWNGQWVTPNLQIGSTYQTPGLSIPYLNVAAIEQVTVPAGTFQAWRLEYSDYYYRYVYWFEQNTGILLKAQIYSGQPQSLTYLIELTGSTLFH